MLGASWVFSDHGRSQQIEGWKFFIVSALCVALCILVATRLPAKYTLSIGVDLIRIDVNRKFYSLYWTSMEQVTLELRGAGQFDMRMRLMPGVRPPVAKGLRLGPRMVEPRVIRMAEPLAQQKWTRLCGDLAARRG